MKIFGLLIIFIILILPAPEARAEKVILFVNMNYSRQEYDAVEKVQKRRGNKLVMVPPLSAIEDIKKLELMRANFRKNLGKLKPKISKEEIDEIILNAEGSGLDKIDNENVRKKFTKTIQEIRKEGLRFRALEEKRGSIADQIREKLDKIKKDKQEIDSLVISAHSDGGDLSSETSNMLTYAELDGIKDDYKGLWTNPRHVLLLGCYTNTQTANLLWRDMFPKAGMIAGFRGQAPKRDNAYSALFVDNVMQMAEDLDAHLAKAKEDESIDPSIIEKSFRQFESVRITDSAIDYCKLTVYGLPDAKLKCYEQWLIFRGTAEKMDQKLLGPLPTEDPPKKTTGTVLRSFYDLLQKLCTVGDAGGSFTENAKVYESLRKAYIYKTIRLIHWWPLQKNFSAYYNETIKSLAGFLKLKKIDATLPALDGKTGRIEFLQKTQLIESLIQDGLEKSEEKLASYLEKNKGKKDSAVTVTLQKEVATWKNANKEFGIYKTLEKMEKDIPLTWIEPNAVLQ